MSTSDGWSTYRVFEIHKADFHLICFYSFVRFFLFFFQNYNELLLLFSEFLLTHQNTFLSPLPFLNKSVVTELPSRLAVYQSLYFIISLFLSPASRSDQLNSSSSRLKPLGWKSLPHCAEPCLWTSGLYRVIHLNTLPDRADTTGNSDTFHAINEPEWCMHGVHFMVSVGTACSRDIPILPCWETR